MLRDVLPALLTPFIEGGQCVHLSALARLRDFLASANVKVIVHVGSFNTAQAVALAMLAKDLGVTGVASLSPYFHRVDDKAQYRYFSRICQAADGMPAYLYNLPAVARRGGS